MDADTTDVDARNSTDSHSIDSHEGHAEPQPFGTCATPQSCYHLSACGEGCGGRVEFILAGELAHAATTKAGVTDTAAAAEDWHT